MNKLQLIIKREFIAKVRNKSFIVMTFLSPLLFVAISVLISYLSSMKADLKTIAIHDETGRFASKFITDSEHKYIDLSAVDLKILKDSIIKESYQGLLLIPKIDDNIALQKSVQYISNDSPNLEFVKKMQDVIAKEITNENFKTAKLDTLAYNRAEAKVDIKLEKSSGEETLKGLNEVKIGVGGAFGYLIMMFIVIYGNMVMRSVIEEKTSRIIEVIISSVKPFQLMMGKIIGTSLAGVIQFIIWAILGLVFYFGAIMLFGVHTSKVPTLTHEQMQMAKTFNLETIKLYFNEIPVLSMFLCFIVYFIGGYFLYSSFYASIGAAVDNETDSQQFLLPIIMPLILGVYIGFFTVMNDPHGTIATVFSMIPLTSPIVMMMRIPFGVPWWQLAISITLLFATFFLVVWFASKIYRVGILMYGKKPTWKELIKWMKY